MDEKKIIWWGYRFAFPPGPRLPAFHAGDPEAHPLLQRGARGRSLDAREASPLRNASSVDCRFAAITQQGVILEIVKMLRSPLRFGEGPGERSNEYCN